MIGMVENRLLFVGYAMRDERIRIISTWKAEAFERRKYHDEKPGSMTGGASMR